MNERIRQLADQCRYEDWIDYGKFAELIVRECAVICNTVSSDEVDNASRDYKEGRERGAIVCRNQILKHFGVVE